MAATTAGVFRLNFLNKNTTDQFYQLSDATQEAWGFARLDDQSFVIITDGIYRIRENRLERINTGLTYCYSLYPSRKVKNRLFVGTADGLAVVDFVKNKWINRGKN